MKNGVSAGPGLILNEFLKHRTNGLLHYLLNLYYTLFEIGYFPESWPEGYIVPIFKKGDKDEPSHYRGIMLLSTVGKLFTRILNGCLNDWTEEYNVYVKAQVGFRKSIGTVDNKFILNSLITRILNNTAQSSISRRHSTSLSGVYFGLNC